MKKSNIAIRVRRNSHYEGGNASILAVLLAVARRVLHGKEH